MKHLILVRHAESGEKVTGQTDKERELTTTGLRQAASVGRFLKHSSYSIDWFIVSSATRTMQTTKLITEQLGFERFQDRISVEEDLYQGSVGTMLELLHQVDAHACIAIVAHNPTISYFAEFVCTSEVEELAPAHTLVFKIPIGSWKEIQKATATLVERFEP